MKDYELAIVLKSSLLEGEQKKLIDSVKIDIAKGGQVTADKALGRKSLAYQIKAETNGLYFVINFQSDSAVPVAISKKLRIDENVLRYLLEQRQIVQETSSKEQIAAKSSKTAPKEA